MSILTGILKADCGEVLWNGEPTKKAGIDFRRIMGYMPQQQGMYDSFTGRRFLAYMCALKEIRGEAVQSEILRTASIVNMTEALDKRLGACSGGMKRVCCLLRRCLAIRGFLSLMSRQPDLTQKSG